MKRYTPPYSIAHKHLNWDMQENSDGEWVRYNDMPKWISVEDELPEPGKQVIILRKNGTWDRGECNPIFFEGLPAFYLPEGPLMTDDVTYWMPLPKP